MQHISFERMKLCIYRSNSEYLLSPERSHLQFAGVGDGFVLDYLPKHSVYYRILMGVEQVAMGMSCKTHLHQHLHLNLHLHIFLSSQCYDVYNGLLAEDLPGKVFRSTTY